MVDDEPVAEPEFQSNTTRLKEAVRARETARQALSSYNEGSSLARRGRETGRLLDQLQVELEAAEAAVQVAKDAFLSPEEADEVEALLVHSEGLQPEEDEDDEGLEEDPEGFIHPSE